MISLPGNNVKDGPNICLSVLFILFFTLSILAISVLPSSLASSKNVSTGSDTLNLPNDTDTLTNKGLSLDSLGNHTGAITYYDKALAITPNDTDTLNNIGNALGKLGKYTEATKYYQKAIEIIKSNHSNQSAIYSQTASADVKSAAYVFTVTNQDFPNVQYIQIADTQNTSQDPKLVIIEMNYAKTLVNIGQYQLAISTYDGILHTDPYNGCALFGKADALDKSGQHEEAAKNYDVAKKLNPTCGTDTVNIQKKVDQPSQIGALAAGFSFLLSHR